MRVRVKVRVSREGICPLDNRGSINEVFFNGIGIWMSELLLDSIGLSLLVCLKVPSPEANYYQKTNQSTVFNILLYIRSRPVAEIGCSWAPHASREQHTGNS